MIRNVRRSARAMTGLAAAASLAIATAVTGISAGNLTGSQGRLRRPVRYPQPDCRPARHRTHGQHGHNTGRLHG